MKLANIIAKYYNRKSREYIIRMNNSLSLLN